MPKFVKLDVMEVFYALLARPEHLQRIRPAQRVRPRQNCHSDLLAVPDSGALNGHATDQQAVVGLADRGDFIFRLARMLDI